MKIKYYSFLLVCISIIISCSQPEKYSWPKNNYGGDEKLFFNENDFEKIRANIDRYSWAENLYLKLKKTALDSATHYPHSGPEIWTKSFIVKEAAIYYRLSGDESVLPFVRKSIVNTYNLDSISSTLFKKGKSLTGFWSWGMFRMGNLAAWDLVKNHPEFSDLVPLMNKRLDEIIDEGIVYNNAIKRLGNTQFWGVTTLGLAGFVRENEQAIDIAINGKHGFKSSLLRFRDHTFWPEPLKYTNGYVASAMHMLAEASKKNNQEDLYHYKAENGASFKGMMDGFVSLLLTDGAIPIRGDCSEYSNVIRDKEYSKIKYFFKEKQTGYRSNSKIELLYSIYKDPIYGWFAAQNSNRDGWDNNFWGWTALTHGIPLEKQKIPLAPSVVYQEFGSALLRSDTTSAYWGSDALSAFIRNGASLQFHSHNDHFALDVIAYKKQLYYDNYLSWDYLAPRKSRNNRNETPFSNRIIAHNTMVVDYSEPDNSVIKLGQKTLEKPGVNFSEIVNSGPMQILTTSGTIYEGVDQVRTIGITNDYVLDIFDCISDENHNYDYILHSFGELSFNFNLDFKPYSNLNKEYQLGEIDTRSKKENNVWLLNTQQSNIDTGFKAVFKDRDSIGICVLIAGDINTKVLKTEVPYYISREGWDEVLPKELPKRKPLLIVRRKTKTTRYIVLHIPFKEIIPEFSLIVEGDKIIIEGPEFIDNYLFREKKSWRINK